MLKTTLDGMPLRSRMMGKKILLVDDDRKIVDLVKLYLNRDGYKVVTAYDGPEALRLARESSPDLIVLDLMLPGLDGLEVCRIIRSESAVPIIMLTAKTSEEDRVAGLGLGADDYVVKPFSPRELAARVRAVLRRISSETIKREAKQITCGNLILNLHQLKVFIDGKTIDLTSTEFRLLEVLAREPEKVFSRIEIIDKVFGGDFEGFDRTIDVHIRNLRRKLEPDPKYPRYIQTVYGAGYKLSKVEG